MPRSRTSRMAARSLCGSTIAGHSSTIASSTCQAVCRCAWLPGQGQGASPCAVYRPGAIEGPHYGHLAAMNQELERGTPLNADDRQGRPSRWPLWLGKPSLSQPPRIAGKHCKQRRLLEQEYFVQVAAFSDPSNAQRTKADLCGPGQRDRSSQPMVATARFTGSGWTTGNQAGHRLLSARYVSRGHVDARSAIATINLTVEVPATTPCCDCLRHSCSPGWHAQ